MKIRCLIIDDEELARERVRSLLKNHPDVDVVAECDSGQAALQACAEHQPDLLFLDVQMPEMDGFDFLAHLPADNVPCVIFTTAYDRFAIKAFEVHALDFLLKPFNKERLESALNRAREQIRLRTDSQTRKEMAALIAELKGETSHPDRLAVKSEGRIRLIQVADIDWVESADNYVSIHVGRESHLMRETLQGIEQRLPPKFFLRISRSTIVNTDRIRELEPLFHGEYSVSLQDGTRLTLTRGYKKALKQLLEPSE